VGYSTCLCHSVSQATSVFDRRAWFQTLQDRLKSTPYPDRLVEGVIKMNLPVLGGHHPFLRAADSFNLPPTGRSQPQSPDRGLAGQLFRRLIRRQPAFQPRREALVSTRPSPADHTRTDGGGCASRLHRSLQLGKLRGRSPRGHAHAVGALLTSSRAALPAGYFIGAG
jgi:hypothetical protein